jgi:hypothetical protein
MSLNSDKSSRSEKKRNSSKGDIRRLPRANSASLGGDYTHRSGFHSPGNEDAGAAMVRHSSVSSSDPLASSRISGSHSPAHSDVGSDSGLGRSPGASPKPSRKDLHRSSMLGSRGFRMSGHVVFDPHQSAADAGAGPSKPADAGAGRSIPSTLAPNSHPQPPQPPPEAPSS